MTLEYNYLINGNSEKISSKCVDVEIKRTAIRWILNPPPNK